MSDSFFKQEVISKKGMMFRAALRILENRQDAEDATSETILKLWLKRDQLKKYENLERVLYTVIKNQCIDLIRARNNFLPIQEGFGLYADGSENDFNQDSKLKRVKAIINELPDKQKMMVHFRMTEGYSMQKIADLMNEKVNTVEVTLSRARKKIREQYEKDITQQH